MRVFASLSSPCKNTIVTFPCASDRIPKSRHPFHLRMTWFMVHGLSVRSSPPPTPTPRLSLPSPSIFARKYTLFCENERYFEKETKHKLDFEDLAHKHQTRILSLIFRSICGIKFVSFSGSKHVTISDGGYDYVNVSNRTTSVNSLSAWATAFKLRFSLRRYKRMRWEDRVLPSLLPGAEIVMRKVSRWP